jgi:uncharacterized protein YdhG (YjbR/CyaY superfamily)
MSDMKKKSTKRTTTRETPSSGWTDAELAAMKEHAGELKRSSRRDPKDARAEGERDVLDKIAEMSATDRAIAEQVHAIITENAPDLAPRTWYGMPAYAKEGKVICFVQPADKFKARYSTLGFNDAATLDEGSMWPTSWALTELTAVNAAKIVALVKKAVS